MNIKNPLTILKNDIGGKPIEVNSLDESLLVKSNIGKIYKVDDKLYRITKHEPTTIPPTDLTGYRVSMYNYLLNSIIPGEFPINFYYNDIFYDNFIIVADDFWDEYWQLSFTSSITNESISIPLGSFFEIDVVGGDASNLTFLIENLASCGATFEKLPYFEELIVPTGTLDITENGTIDVTNYASANVNVASSSSGAELNIHYGQTAPEDTSKLWVKCNTPSKVEVKNTIEGGEESIEVLVNALPTKASNIASAVVGTKVYLFGGYNGSVGLNTINVFDTETNSITTLSTTLPKKALGIASAVVGTKVYLFGGNDGASNLNTINVFDTETSNITTLSTTIPTSSNYIASAVVGTKVYLFGGYKTLNTINVFDTKTNAITTLSTRLPTGANGIASAVVGTKVYLFGGSSVPNTINVFDTETNSITTLSTTLPTGAGYIASAVVGAKVYLFGGSGNLNTINVFDTETNNIKTLSTKLPTGAYGIASAVVGTKVYLFGGNNNNVLLKDINRFNITFDVNNGTLLFHHKLNSNKVSIIKNDVLDVQIGLNMVLLGNSENIGEEVDVLENKIIKKYNKYYTESAIELSSGTSLTSSVKCNVGDLVVCAIATRDTLTVSDGWTLVSTSNVNSVDTYGQRLSWAYKYAESTTESITVTQASEQRLYINMIALQGATGVTDNGYSYKDDTTDGDITVTKPSGLVLWGLSRPLWGTTTPYEVWIASNNIPIIQLGTSTQSRLGLGVDQTNETNVKFTYNVSSAGSSLIVGCLTVQGMDKFYNEYEVQEWVKI